MLQQGRGPRTLGAATGVRTAGAATGVRAAGVAAGVRESGCLSRMRVSVCLSRSADVGMSQPERRNRGRGRCAASAGVRVVPAPGVGAEEKKGTVVRRSPSLSVARRAFGCRSPYSHFLKRKKRMVSAEQSTMSPSAKR